MIEFKNIALADIHPDPDQPRKFFDETAMQELTESVREKGVLQPVLIRPNAQGYVLVCGERRFRASVSAGLESIPAVIRQLSNEEALEMQIIENLQRKDVHPMEEAVAFRSLMDGKQWTISEVAHRVGKKDYFIRQRLKLNELTEAWQKIFYHNRINLGDALEISQLPASSQESLYSSEVKESSGRVYLGDWTLRNFKGDLTEANFDLADPALDRKMGPCTTCQYNTAAAQLFADKVKPRCMNVSCFKHKNDVFFDRELKIVKEDPAVILITAGYTDSKLADQLRKEGFPVLKSYDDYRDAEEPELPVWEDYLEENEEEFQEDPEGTRNEFQQHVEGYQQKKEAFDKAVATGKYKKAFEVAGHRPGRYCYVQLEKRYDQKSASTAVSSGMAGVDDIDTEATRILDREKRAKELDAEKVHKLIVEDLQKHPSLKNDALPLTATDRTLIKFLLYEYLSYHTQDVRKKLGLPELPYHSTIDKTRVWMDKLATLTEGQMAYLVRQIVISKYSQNLPQHTGGTALRLLAESLGDIPIAQYESAQNVKAMKREFRVDQRVNELKAQKKELQAAAKPKKASSKTK